MCAGHHDTTMAMKDHEVTVPMSDELHNAMVSQLDYGDTKAGYIRDAVRERLEREGVEIPGDPQTDGGQATLAD